MKFLQTIQNSIYSPKFYSDIHKKSFKESIVYFLLLSLILTVITTIPLIQPILAEVPMQIQGFLSRVKDCFPVELEVKVLNGQISTNTTEPYFISPCGSSNSQKIAVIDTKNTFSPEKFAEYKVYVWITKNSVVYKKDNYETRTYNVDKIKDFKLNKSVLNSYYNQFTPWIKFIGPILLIVSFTGIFLSYSLRLIYLLLIASLIWLLGKLFKQLLTFAPSYKLSLHAVTLGLIVELVLGLLRPWIQFQGFPFMVSILTLGVVTLNLFLPKNGQNPQKT